MRALNDWNSGTSFTGTKIDDSTKSADRHNTIGRFLRGASFNIKSDMGCPARNATGHRDIIRRTVCHTLKGGPALSHLTYLIPA